MNLGLKEFLKITSEGLAKKQLDDLKVEAILTLKKIINLIKEEDFNTIRIHLDTLDDFKNTKEIKTSILFDFSDKAFENDIGNLVDKLEELKNLCKKNGK